MSPPRRTATAEVRDPLERILDKLDAVERELADVKQALEKRLVPVETAVGAVANHEERLKKLEEHLAEARGAAWAGRMAWALLLAVGAVIGVLVKTFIH